MILPSSRNDGTSDLCRVTNLSRNNKGESLGTFDQNPLLNTQIYDVEDPEGKVRKYSANVIAENIYDWCDNEGHCWNTAVDIVGHNQADNTVRKDDQFVYYKNRRAKRQRKTTVGWKLRCKLSDGTHQWFDLKDLKQSNPVEVARYARSCDLAEEPAFKWWVPYTLKKVSAISKAVISRLRASKTKNWN